MLYPSVYRAHIVPKGYLRGFAIDGKIAVRKVGKAASEVKSVDKAGTRARYYRRTRPDGTTIDDIEWSLSHIEDKAPPILRALDALWPLDAPRKAVLAELFGYQLVRGPRWAEWHERYVRERLAEYRQALGEDAASFEDVERHLLSNTYRMTRMLDLGLRLASLLGSMHWSLLEFTTPLLATSDHPVVVWPLSERGRWPEGSASEGLLNALEARLPVTPQRAILMTWLEANDAPGVRLRGTRQHASSLNAFTVANAEREWFHLPGTTPPIATGALPPLSSELLPGYRVEAVACSQRRSKVAAWLEETKEHTLTDRDKLILT